MTYLKFLKQKIYLCILIIFGFAMLGSVLGARKESKEPLNGITQEDTLIMQQGTDAPELIGILPLAANQNNWYNFKYAFIFGCAGILVYCILMAVYMPLYHFRFFVFIRRLLGSEEENKNLFIHLS